jgi:hypothetical protein
LYNWFVRKGKKNGRPEKGGGEKMEKKNQKEKEFQNWLENKMKNAVSLNAAKNFYSEQYTPDMETYELRAFETKSGHTELFNF